MSSSFLHLIISSVFSELFLICKEPACVFITLRRLFFIILRVCLTDLGFEFLQTKRRGAEIQHDEIAHSFVSNASHCL